MDKHDWKGASAYIEENGNNDIIFIDPFYHQQPFTYYYDIGCFKDSDMLSCNTNKIKSLDWKAECCSDSTRLSATDNNLSD